MSNDLGSELPSEGSQGPRLRLRDRFLRWLEAGRVPSETELASSRRLRESMAKLGEAWALNVVTGQKEDDHGAV